MASVEHYTVTFPTSHDPGDRVTGLPRGIVQDNTLSFAARGLAAFLATARRPVTMTDILASTSSDVTVVQLALRELIQHELVAVVAQ